MVEYGKLMEVKMEIERSIEILNKRIGNLENKFHTKTVNLIPVKNWNELSNQLEKNLKGYKPRDVTYIFIDNGFIKIVSYKELEVKNGIKKV